jgi:hypothetical protein
MDAYGDYTLFLAKARIEELRREAANARLASALERRRPRLRHWLLKRREAPQRVLPLPALRRSS